MGRSFSMAAYRALSRRSADRAFTPSGPRPQAELVWLHAAEASNLLALQDLAQRLCVARDGLRVLITLPDRNSLDAARTASPAREPLHLDELPSEHPAAVDRFLDHWAPDMCIWAWGGLRPILVQETQRKGCPMVLIDADTGGFDGRRDRWLPDLTRELLSEFVALMARSTQAASRLQQLGLRRSEIEVTPPLQAGGQALPCDDTDLAEMTKTLGGRPVWLATAVRAEETDMIFAAHRHALRFSHRLLLILQPAVRDQAGVMSEKAALEGFRVSDWSAPGEPNETTQVMVAEDADDLGLFYRLAPVSFLGSSLVPGHGGGNPFEAAALGSAVLYGPNVRRYLPFYSRLANAGAARIVKDAQTLGSAVTRLIAPDQAAAMAHAGWDVISQGAELTDRVIELVEETLDTRLEQKNARA
ncbi:3-deoxy-D-manno-octulosonic acid transferase [Roseobacter sinensis]|uniref:3-deoxy-D-manno-octulosonic acid transferase n=1 Tax=Roseobacter sinensis TaxID=2931391 RepID=A0ABT3B9E8_9RHOB|nr:glycosyltransferase N-terminal domain-containing protein [Roseobacter sp. WL0113]MCV3270191.1 3-deoxy-D-manno-octulosonic acid transferase [Roseobacter sp. WL0113]